MNSLFTKPRHGSHLQRPFYWSPLYCGHLPLWAPVYYGHSVHYMASLYTRFVNVFTLHCTLACSQVARGNPQHNATSAFTTLFRGRYY